jgi:hypothetical protein
MPPFLQVNDQFAVLVLETVRVDANVTLPVTFSNQLQLVGRYPIRHNRRWATDKGSLFWRGVKESSFFLVYRQPGRDPNLLPNDDIKRPLTAFLRGLILTGIPWSDGQYFLTGGVHADRIDLRQIQELREFRLDLGLPRADHFDEARLRTAYDLGQKIIAMSAGGWHRITRGFHFLGQALIADWMEDRFHMFIRAMDAVVKTPYRRGTEAFIERCGSTFLAPHRDNDETLRDMYYIRNAIEHIHDTEPESHRLVGATAAVRKETRERRLRQLEVMALAVYRRIIGDPALLADLDTDTKIDAFWAQPAAARAARWNAPVALHTIT